MLKITDKFKESLIENCLNCSKSELEEYLLYGLVLEQKNEYYDRNFNKLKIVSPSTMNINLSNIVIDGLNLSKAKHKKRIYYMTEKTFNNYQQKGYIIFKDNNNYYRIFNNEEWLVSILK